MDYTALSVYGFSPTQNEAANMKDLSAQRHQLAIQKIRHPGIYQVASEIARREVDSPENVEKRGEEIGKSILAAIASLKNKNGCKIA